MKAGARGMTQRMTAIQPEWLPDLLEPVTRRAEAESGGRLAGDDRGVLLTELQRAALRWVSSFD